MQIQKDEYTPDGKRLFNPTRPHGVIYADGFSESKFVQDGQHYRGDRTPIDGLKERPNDPPKVKVIEKSTEEVALAKRVDNLENLMLQMAQGIQDMKAVVLKPKGKPGRKPKVPEVAPQ